MRFEPTSQKYRLDARRRIVTLTIFGVVVAGIFIGLTRSPDVLQKEHEFLDLSVDRDDVDKNAMVIGPGEGRVQIPPPPESEVEGGTIGDAILDDPLSDVPPVVDPQPFEESPEILHEAASADGTSIVPERPLTYLFQRIRTNEHWTNDGQLTSLDEQNRLWKIIEEDTVAVRGKEFVLEGVLISDDRDESPLEIFGLPPGNPSGLNRFYRGYLKTSKGFYLVATYEKPERALEDRDRVRIRAAFMQIYSNKILKDGQLKTRSIPFVVGKSFSRVPFEPGPSFVSYLPYVVIGLIGAFAIALIVVQIIMNRGDHYYDKRVRRLRSSLARHARDTRESGQSTAEGEKGC